MTTTPIRIAIDAVGGDDAPAPVLAGIDVALTADPALEVVLVGPAGVVDPFVAGRDRVEALHASEIIAMDEHATNAIRAKRDSSIVVGCAAVRDGKAQGFFSAGNTGAMMAASTLIMGRIPGVQRPAIATVLPTAGAPLVLLDAGANADCRPEHLLQFAHMGVAYARAALSVDEPRVGLLNIGEEEGKGSQLVQDAYGLLKEAIPTFVGNVEGRDVPAGTVDVVVTDGFTGNVVLKLMEGMSRELLGQFKAAMLSGPVNKVAAAVLRPALESLRDKLDPESHGAAPLLGVAGLALIGHGSSGQRAVAAALRVGATAVRGGLVERIATSLSGDA